MARFVAKFKLPQFQQKFVLPEKYKGTFVEKWATYWKSLYADYRGMVTDLVVEIQEKPRKALYITSGIVVAWQLAKHNPDESDFKEDLLRYSNELMQVSEACQNPRTVQHFKYLNSCYNHNVLRVANLGLASLLWVDDYDDACDAFKTNCEYTQPSYFSVLQRTVDIGFMGKWWNIYRKYQNFDVNL